ncbi:MAG: hypothetical protein ACPGVG_14920 [Mycobacterium sp.]
MNLTNYLRHPNVQALSDAVASEGFMLLAAHWSPVPANRVKQWLGANALRLRLTAWLDAVKPTLQPLDAAWMSDAGNAGLAAMVNGVEVVMTVAEGDSLDLAPGVGNRMLLEAMAAHPQIPLTEADRDALLSEALAPGWVWPTEADVASARAEIEAEDARQVREVRLRDAHNAALVVIENGGDDAAVEAAFVGEWNS